MLRLQSRFGRSQIRRLISEIRWVNSKPLAVRDVGIGGIDVSFHISPTLAAHAREVPYVEGRRY